MSYETIVEAMNALFETLDVEGLTVLDYEPTTIEPPTLYTLFDSVEYLDQGQVKGTRYRILHRLCLRWQDNEMAEQELKPYINGVRDVIKADPHLGGALNSGLARIAEAIGGWTRIADTTYRIVDFYSSVFEKE